MEITMKSYQSQIIDGCIASFTFSEKTGQEAFQKGLEELSEWVTRGGIKYLMVNVTDMTSAWNKEAQKVWLDTGVLCDKHGILKWGVVSPDIAKSYTIRHLIKGAGAKRYYATRVSNSENEITSWFNRW